MKNRIRHILQSLHGPESTIMLLFGIEGIFLQFATSVNSFGNNLYATNMGATDSQIGLISLVPNLVACIALLPLGILSDRLRSSKTVPLVTLLLMAFGYFCFATVPVMGAARMTLFFVFLAFTAGGLAIYNAQWQAFFGDVTPLEQRNSVFAFRNQFMFSIGILAPLICGVLMGGQPDSDGKVLVLRIFFYLAGAFMLLQAYVISRIPGAQRSDAAMAELAKKRFSARDVTSAIADAMRNRDFRMFFFPILFFYVGWHMDWSMWFIGMTQYVGMTETAISIYNGIFNIGQLIAIGLVAKLVQRKSADSGMLLAIGGLVLCPIIMMICPVLPAPMRSPAFTIMITLFNAPQCAVALCVVQMLLKAAPEKNRSLIISLYNMVIMLSNSLMPWLGVQLYTAFGADLRALYLFNTVSVVWRLATLLLFLWRYRLLKREGRLTTVGQ